MKRHRHHPHLFTCPMCDLKLPHGQAVIDHIKLCHPNVKIVAEDMDLSRGEVYKLLPHQLDALGFEWVEGYDTAFCRREAPGAYPNGTRIVKVKTEDGDGRPVGEEGVVLGSMEHPRAGLAYFVEWDSHRKRAVFVVAWKISAVQPR